MAHILTGVAGGLLGATLALAGTGNDVLGRIAADDFAAVYFSTWPGDDSASNPLRTPLITPEDSQ